MRVCFLNHNLDSATGAGRFGSSLVSYMQKAHPDIEAVVLTSVGSGHLLERPVLASNWFGLLISMPQIRAEFRRADIIHALDGYPYGAIAAIALIGIKRPLVITAIGTGAVQPLYRWHKWLVRRAYRRAKKITAISSYTKKEILKKIPDLSIDVINHAVDASEFDGDPMSGLTEQEKTKIRGLKPYILSVGGWKKRKGFEYSFPAFAGIRKQFPKMNYVICGIGPKPRLEEPHGLSGSVHYFKGVRWPFLKALYSQAELFFLLPVDDDKDIEGFGFSFLEAAAAGLPVIGTRSSGAEDAVLDGENGFLVPSRDPEAASLAAIRILSDDGLQKRMASSSRAFAERMTWERVTDAYRKIYDGCGM